MIEGILMLIMLLFNFCILLHAKALSKRRRVRLVSALFDFSWTFLPRTKRKEGIRRA
jgi:hypothetical protein